MLKVIEIFESIQGEGKWMGTPVTFIRLAGCNLHCPWCDTKESWGDVGGGMLVDEIIEKVTAYRPMHVVITGGEPTLQLDELNTLIGALRDRGYYTGIETNGTNSLKLSRIHWVTCSPKPESDYLIACSCDEIKLVITEDFNEATLKRIATKHNDIPIWLQPDGFNMQAMWKRCYELAMKYGNNVRVGVQLHKLMEVR